MKPALLAACLTAVLAFPGAAPASDDSLVGRLAPSFTLSDLSGNKIALPEDYERRIEKLVSPRRSG